MAARGELLTLQTQGLWCEPGGFFVDPHRAVDKALVTHAHADHARSGCRAYLCAQPSEGLLRQRLGKSAPIESLPYGQTRRVGSVSVSFHPSGHVLGAAQIRLEHAGNVWVVSGDYKLQSDPTCAAFEPVRCQTFISECTFGLPVYRWPESQSVYDEVNAWWRGNRRVGRHSFLYGYSLGKAQRLLAGLDESIGSIYVHPAVHELLPCYRAAGVKLPPTERVSKDLLKAEKRGAMVVLPPAAADSKCHRGVGAISTAFASGWMLLRGPRNRRAMDRGFVMSDHADWDGLNEAILATGAERVYLTHGRTDILERWLQEKRGLDVRCLVSSEASPEAQVED